MNEKVLRYVMRRDFGNKEHATCLYCKKPLKIDSDEERKSGDRMKVVLDHLDDNPKNNNYWNQALVHQGCNQDKRNNIDYQVIAHDKKVESMAYTPSPSEDVSERRDNANVKMGNKIQALVEAHLKRMLPPGLPRALPLDDLCDELAYLAQKKFKCGSQPTMKRHIMSLCSLSAPWQVTYETGRPLVSRRDIRVDQITRAARRRKKARKARRRAGAGSGGPAAAAPPAKPPAAA